ncbi:HAD family hydrolase [Archaeoglobales archaeon]|nr:MAG: HAD family hydrolase [Archaeoglobales archaeon]
MKSRVENVIFDLDGTLTELNLPFDEIRKALNIKGRFILETILESSGKERENMFEVLKKFEIEAAKDSKLNEGALELIEFLEKEGIKKGVVTRNCLESVLIFSKKFGIDFDYIVSREAAPPKPSPLPMIRAIISAKSTPDKSISIGDFKFDLLSGKLAGIKTVLLITERNRSMISEFISLADHTVTDLRGLIRILRI